MRVARSLRLDVHMLDEHGFEHAAQVESRPHVAVIEQRRAREPRPIGYHAGAAHGSAREKRAAARPMIGTSGAVHGGGAATRARSARRNASGRGMARRRLPVWANSAAIYEPDSVIIVKSPTLCE